MDPTNPHKILFVCTGNIFRSMSAEYAARAHLGQRSDIVVESAGTKPFPQTMRAEVRDRLRDRGIDPAAHQIRAVNDQILSGSHLVVAMGLGHREHLERHFGVEAPYFLEVARGEARPVLDVDEGEFDPRTDREAALRHAIHVVDLIWEAMPDFLANYRRWVR